MYSKEEQNTKRSSVVDVLAHFGKDVRFNRSGFLTSPFRDENTPSFHITSSGRGWKDFGDGSGGGVIDLVMRLTGKDRAGAIKVLREIESGGTTFSSGMSAAARTMPGNRTENALEIYSMGELTSEALKKYARSRGISDTVLKAYCRQIGIKRQGKTYPVEEFIGFPNNMKGFALRNGKPAKKGKRCTSSHPSFIDRDGKMTQVISSDSVMIFEGFFDFLSYIQLFSAGRLAPGKDVCVLNSITNRDKAKDYILGHSIVELYLDNDNAGKKTADEIRNEIQSFRTDCKVIDRSVYYSGFKDLNEFLSGQKECPAQKK